MPSYLIRFNDGSYHHEEGIGDSTTEEKYAARYYSIEDAKKMVWELCDVDAIVTSGRSPLIMHKY